MIYSGLIYTLIFWKRLYVKKYVLYLDVTYKTIKILIKIHKKFMGFKMCISRKYFYHFTLVFLMATHLNFFWWNSLCIIIFLNSFLTSYVIYYAPFWGYSVFKQFDFDIMFAKLKKSWDFCWLIKLKTLYNCYLKLKTQMQKVNKYMQVNYNALNSAQLNILLKIF